MKKIFILSILVSSSVMVYAEGSKDMYPRNGVGYRSYLNSRFANDVSSAAYDPFPNSGTHKVYVRANETIYAGSSSVTSGKVLIINPSGNTVATSNGTNGRIQTRDQELEGPKTSRNTNGYQPLTHKATTTGIYEVKFLGDGTGTTMDNNTPSNFAVNKPNLNNYTNTSGNALIEAWDVTVGSASDPAVFIPGRVYTTVLNLTGFNSTFSVQQLYSKLYIYTPAGFLYQFDNNGNNGASFNIFSNNKGFVTTDNDFTSPSSYKSLNSTSVGSGGPVARYADPRKIDISGTTANRIFYNIPDTTSFTDSTVMVNTYDNNRNVKTWLKGATILPQLSNVFIGCDKKLYFHSNIEGRYQILIDANNDGNFNNTNDIILSGPSVSGANVVSISDAVYTALGNNRNAKFTLRLTTGEVHIPLLDMEANANGMKIHRIINGQPVPTEIYWDNTGLDTTQSQRAPEPLKQLDGVLLAVNGSAHSWSSNNNSNVETDNYGNNRSIDTWTFVKDEVSTNIKKATCIAYSGKVWNDVNLDENFVGEKNVSGTSTETQNTVTTGENLYVYVVNNQGVIIDRTSVNADGTYTLNKLPQSETVNISLAKENYSVGQQLVTASLPNGWDYVCYKNGTNTGVKHSSNSISVTTGTAGLSDFNIGIYKTPKPGSGVLNLVDQGGTTNVAVPPAAFSNVSSTTSGSNDIASLLLTGLPSNVTSITIGTRTYTAANFPQEGLNIPTNAQGVPSVDVFVDPAFEGRGDVVLTYATVDARGRVSSTTGTATLKFAGTISGSVWNDGNGNLTNTVNENENKLTGNGNSPQNNVETIPGGSLYAYLTDILGNVIETQPIAADGTYKFTNITTDQALKVIISTNQYNVNQVATATLPENWVTTGVNTGSATIVAAKAEYEVGVLTNNVTNLDFGIQQAPVSSNNRQQLATNPRPNTIIALDNSVVTTDGTLNEVIGSDKETDALKLTLKINTLPYSLNVSNGKIPSDANLIYDGKIVNEVNFPGLAIPNFKPELLAINMLGAGYTNVGFDFVFVDEAGANSPIYSYNIEWTVPLPLHLISFNAYANQNNVRLDWTTNNEHNMANFDVEYSIDGAQWKSLGIVNAVNLSGINNYSFEHNNVKNVVNIYRLRMNNTDLTKSYSKVAKVILNAPKSAFNIYPNPATDVITIDGLSAITSVKVVDVMGKVIMTQNVTAEMMTLDISTLVTGQYMLQLINTDQNIESIKFLKK